MTTFIVGIFLSTLIVDLTPAETATLRMRFVYDGAPPPPKEIDLAPAFAPLAVPLIDERLMVDPKSNGIKNVLVYLYTGRGGSKITVPDNQYPNQKRCMTMENGRFDPHILIARSGDTLEFVQQGPNQYNPNVNFLINEPRGFQIPPGKPLLIPVPKPEPAAIPVDCNIHPWMRAYVVVLDHSFAAVTDKDGKLEIKGLPVDTPLTFRVFHESIAIDRAKIAGTETEWRRRIFKTELAAGVNDLGDVFVPSEELGD